MLNYMRTTDSLSPTLALACDLISRPSVTPEDAGCQALMAERLEKLGFRNHHLRFDDVDNLWAVYGESGPIFAFAGHTDVVPAGPLDQWQSPPFEPSFDGDFMVGRGTADMKGSLAAMVTACERFLTQRPKLQHRIAFLITSDEEGIAINGTQKVVQWLEEQGEKITWCLVGEPSSSERVGDIVKNGRRGSLNAELIVKGRQGHVAYPHKADNPIHRVAPALAELAAEPWDNGNDFFPATSFQISNINSGTGATNVIPGEAKVVFNFRFSTEVTDEELRQRTEAILNKHKLVYEIQWQLSGQPFLTEPGSLVNAVTQSIEKVTAYTTELSTAGGTSDGRFIAPTGAQVVELGPCNATIHQINECVRTQDLEDLSLIYENILVELLTEG